ncbi:hypothetical protein [uncultured Eudoraea sp.]|uniref:hypothetical protein n=1 Tax=uncultured Eudoraea sp. TaxID=1035614 RepID=UPI0026206AE3|nr:hypothetical protein [uncultured Eudoraea sp.]
MFKNILFAALFTLTCLACSKESTNNTTQETDNNVPITFGNEQSVSVQGYDSDIMEPFLSRDGTILLFNNLNQDIVNTDLHWALKIDDTTFDYQGIIEGINTPDLEAVASMDLNNTLYYVYTGAYFETLDALYTGIFNTGMVQDSDVVSGISRDELGWINFDAEISADGNTLYFVDGRFEQTSYPLEANLVIAKKTGNSFAREANSEAIFEAINTDHLEYAPALSQNELEIYFTRLTLPLGDNPEAKIYLSQRSSTDEPFGSPQLISEISGFVEGATLNSDDTAIYYHKKVNDLFLLYYLEKE